MSVLVDEMKSHALEAQKFSRKHLVLELDFSEASIQELEGQCDSVEYAIRGGKSPENIEKLAKIWGAYLGESLRRATQAEWFIEESGGQRRIGLKGAAGRAVYPHEHVRCRLTQPGTESLAGFFRSARQALTS
jgi:hypothetical protein